MCMFYSLFPLIVILGTQTTGIHLPYWFLYQHCHCSVGRSCDLQDKIKLYCASGDEVRKTNIRLLLYALQLVHLVVCCIDIAD